MKKKVLLAIGLLFLILFLGLVGLTVYSSSQEGPDFPDLLVLESDVPEAENAFHLLEQAGEALAFSEWATAEYALLVATNWNANEASAILDKNREALRLLEEARSFPRIIVPPIDSLEQYSAYLEAWRKLAYLQAIHARSLFEAGQEKQAFDQLVLLVNQGHKMQDSHGSRLHYFAGAAVKTIAFTQWTNFLVQTSIDCNEMVNYLDGLDAYRPNLSGLSNAVKVEFQLGIKAIEGIQHGSFPGETNSKAARVIISVGVSPFLSRTKTEQMFAQVARAALESANQHYNEMPIHSAIDAVITDFSKGSHQLLQRNVIGKLMAGMLLRLDGKIFSRICHEDFNASTLRILHAIRCYKEKTGHLPKTLDALVPAYLPSVPLDSFDGQVIRYSLERGIIYSVGPDLIDSGGTAKGENKEILDYVVPIDF